MQRGDMIRFLFEEDHPGAVWMVSYRKEAGGSDATGGCSSPRKGAEEAEPSLCSLSALHIHFSPLFLTSPFFRSHPSPVSFLRSFLDSPGSRTHPSFSCTPTAALLPPFALSRDHLVPPTQSSSTFGSRMMPAP